VTADQGEGYLAVDVPRGEAGGDVEAIRVDSPHLYQVRANQAGFRGLTARLSHR